MPASTSQISQLKEVIEKLVPLMTGKGLTVTQRGAKAYTTTDPKTGKPVSVNIPNISDNASPDFVRAIQGFIDHEVAHVLFTDFKLFTDNGADLSRLTAKQKRFVEIHNIIEDTMIERRMVREFEGSARNLSDLRNHYIEKVTKPALAKAKSPEEEFQYLFVSMSRALAGQTDFIDFMDDGGYWKNPVVEDVLSKLSSESKNLLQKSLSTKETHKVTKEFEKIFFGDDESDDEENEDEDDDKPDQKAGLGNGTGQRDHSKSKPEMGEDEGEGKGGSGSGEGDGEGDGEGEGEDGASSGGLSEGNLKGKMGEGAEGGESVATDGATGGGNGSFEAEDNDKSSGGGGVGNSVVSKSMFDFKDDAFDAADISSKLVVEIEAEAVDMMAAADYNVYTTEFDRIEPLVTPEINKKWIPDMEEQTSLLTGRMQKDIERLMASQSHVIRTPGFKSGKLHMASLHRVSQGDVRVFTQKQEHKSKDTAVMLLVDNSGSMSGEKMRIAMLSAYALARTLDRVNIKCEVLGFTTGGWGDVPRNVINMMHEEARNSKINYDRDTPLVMPIYKTFDERLNTIVKSRIAYALNAQNGLAGNIDGECLRIAANRLHARPEKRKIMLVLSDGQPAGSHRAAPHLKRTVKDIIKEGIECIGIGIKTDAVRKFYDNNVVLNDTNELPNEVMGQLKKILS